MTLIILHLSDLHLRSQDDAIVGRSGDIADCVNRFAPQATAVLIAVSGDITHSGSEAQFDAAYAFIAQIQSRIQENCKKPTSVVLCPGNHDCDFTTDTDARELIIDALAERGSEEVDTSVVDTCTAIQGHFFRFRSRFEGPDATAQDKLVRTTRLQVSGSTVELVSLNTAWLTRKKQPAGKLHFPVQLMVDRTATAVDVRIALLHHPFNWFAQASYRPFRQAVRSCADVVITGHEHEGCAGAIDDTESGCSIFIEAWALQDPSNPNASSFNIIQLNSTSRELETLRYVWNGREYVPDSQEQSSGIKRTLARKQASPFAIRPEFQSRLNDVGAFLIHPGTDKLTLSDVFVYPDLRPGRTSGPSERTRTLIPADKLLDSEVTAKGVLIAGEEKSGATSLLFRLFAGYHAQGFVPVLLRGPDLRASKPADLVTPIARAVTEQYGEAAQIAYDKLPLAKRIILFDDFDDSPARSDHTRTEILAEVRRHADHLVITVGESFEVERMLSVEKAELSATFEYFRIQPFGFTRRLRLIQKWFEAASGIGGADEEFIARCDAAEKVIDDVMTKMVIPSYPLYLLVLLQSIDAGQAGLLKESALGYYYQYLLTGALGKAGVETKQLTEYFPYLFHLAWRFHTLGKRRLTRVELQAFNADFSKEWHTVSFEPRTQVLLQARVLHNSGDEYEFRYPYIYYFLKGKYIADHLGEAGTRAYVEHCCKHLYVRDHANTIIFLAHHTNDDVVLDAIVASLRGLFAGSTRMVFGDDTQRLTRLIGDAPKLTYDGSTPVDARRRRSELRDQHADQGDGLAAAEEDAAELSLSAELVTLFKTAECLGQLLKNKYAKIRRTRKAELVRELFDAPLRSLRRFVDLCERNPESLVIEVDAALAKRGKIKDAEQRRALARQAAAQIVHFVVFGFISRTADNVNSEELTEDVSGVVASDPSVAYRMFEMAIRLDSPKSVPREDLERLYGEVSKDIVCRRMLEMMVVKRLYMFKTTERDMQWISEKLKLDINFQHRIAYGEGGRRLS